MKCHFSNKTVTLSVNQAVVVCRTCSRATLHLERENRIRAINANNENLRVIGVWSVEYELTKTIKQSVAATSQGQLEQRSRSTRDESN